MTHLKRTTLGVVWSTVVRERIIDAYRANNWNTTRSAEALGVARRTLLRWVRRYQLQPQIDAARQEQDQVQDQAKDQVQE